MSPIENECLDLIRKGLLFVAEDGSVHLKHPGRNQEFVKVQHWNRGRARFCFSFRGKGLKQGMVYRNRLVWMLTHKQPIPDTCHIDHVDGDKTNDSPDNLALMGITESHQQGNDVQAGSVFAALCRFFEFIAAVGREPMTPNELGYVETGY